MKIKNGFIKSTVNNVQVAVPVGDTAEKFNAMITLNSTAAFLWDLLEKDRTQDELVAALLEKYDIDEQIAKRDVNAFIEKAKGAGILE